MKELRGNHSNWFAHLPAFSLGTGDVGKTRRGIKIAAVTLLVPIVLFVVANLAIFALFPADKAMPNTRIDNIDVSSMSRGQIILTVEEFKQDVNIIVNADSVTERLTLSELGIELDTEATVDTALRRNNQWYMAASELWSSYKRNAVQPVFSVDEKKTEKALTTFISSLEEVAKNASLATGEDGSVSIVSAVEGYDYNAEGIKADILEQLSFDNQVIELSSRIVTPKITTEQAQKQLSLYNSWQATTFGVETESHKEAPTATQRAGWISIDNRPEDDVLAVGVNSDQITAYITAFAAKVDESAKDIVITRVNGVETKRSEGENGQAVDRAAALGLIEKALTNNQKDPVILPMVAVAPKTVYSDSYSQDNAGLSKLLSDWVSKQPASYGIVIQELHGQQRRAIHNADKSFVTASTYKMFLAYALLTEVDAGNMKLSDPSGYADWNVASCIREMIRNSTNFCSIKLGEKIGWQKATDIVRAAGFVSTNLNNYNSSGALAGDKASTARDEASFVQRLNAGELLSGSSTELLLQHMRLQKWRGGIPAGLPAGVVSADKVGFLDAYNHDIAVVYAPGGSYVLAIMSYGGSDYTFSDLSGEVYKYFN